jgi:hypothetical protein
LGVLSSLHGPCVGTTAPGAAGSRVRIEDDNIRTPIRRMAAPGLFYSRRPLSILLPPLVVVEPATLPDVEPISSPPPFMTPLTTTAALCSL